MRRHIFAYGAAAALTPYLAVKVFWVIGGLLGLVPHGTAMTSAGWLVLNLVTIVLAAAGIALGLALARPWGRRIPAGPVLAGAWIGTGFLIPMMPYLAVTGLLGGGGGDRGGADPVMPAWEGVLIGVSFAAMAICLAVAVPGYLRERWPAAFRGRAGGPAALMRAGVAAAVAVGLLELYWAAGGPAGLADPGARDRDWHLLTANSAIWAFAGAAAAWSLTRGRPAGAPRWLPLAVAWTASGFLFAWSAWKLPLAGYLAFASPDPGLWPERFDVVAIKYVAGVAAGALLLAVVIRASSGEPDRNRFDHRYPHQAESTHADDR